MANLAGRHRAAILHVSANLRQDGGGAAQYGRQVGRALRHLAVRRRLRFEGMHLPESDGHPALDGYASFAGRPWRLAIALARRQAGAERPALIFFDHPGPSRAQGWLPRSARSPYLVSLIGIEVWRPLAASRARALANAATLLSISRATAERARPFLPAGPPVKVLHPGLEATARGGEPDRALLEALGSGYALIVARLSATERYKGHDELIEAWPEIVRRSPGARLVVVGEGDDRARLEDRARAVAPEGAIRFTGAVSEATLAEIYRRAALFVMPSRGEGFGLVFLEAMAASLPCVALAGTAPAEIIDAGRTGLLVAEGDRGALVEALTGLFAEPARARALGEAGRRRSLDEFGAEAFARRFEERISPWLPAETP